MRHILFKFSKLMLLFFVFSNASISQQLLETRDGSTLFNPLITNNPSISKLQSALIKVNVSDQTLGGEYYRKIKTYDSDENDQRYWYMNLGFKAKPTEGYANVFKSRQFSPGVSFNIAISKFKVFDHNDPKPDDSFTDWLSFYCSANFDKYQLYRKDTVFNDQLYSKNFNGYGGGINYNMLLNSAYLLSVNLSYLRKSNFSELDEIEVNDTNSEFDSITSSFRTIRKTKAAKLSDKYYEFDDWSLKLSFTKLADDNRPENSFQIGYSIYGDLKFPKNKSTFLNAGIILFLAQSKNNISNPIIGLDFRFNDFFDSGDQNSGLFKRFSMGLTSVISIR